MADIATITTMLGAITNSISIAKTIKNTDSTLEKAELKLKIAELIELLADAKISANEIQEIIKERDKKIYDLENLLEFKKKLIRKNGMYFESDDDGNLIEEPFCSNCWDDSKKSIYLTNRNYYFECPKCKNSYHTIQNDKNTDKILSNNSGIINKMRGF